jgi:hypothetical protein
MEDEEVEAMEEEATSGRAGGGGVGQKRTAPPAADLSASSGAAKRRAKKAESAAAAAPPDLRALILLALPSFQGRVFYRSMLRAKVQQIDPAKPLKRKFGDKDEWRVVLQQLQTDGMLSFTEERDEIAVPLPTPS